MGRALPPLRRPALPTALAALACAGQAALLWRILPACWRVPDLARAPLPAPAGPLPRLSIIAAARDEAATLRPAVASFLAQDYPDYELILIDDRSTDGTGAILAEVAAAHPGRVQILAVAALPPGWLGKNHALWLGARRATGAWLLFTDADVVLAPDCCRRAVAYAAAQGLAHLTLAPRVLADGYWLAAFVAFFKAVFLALYPFHRANDPKSPVAVGLGGFNLIRREAYAALGTHAALALRPDDDLRLAARVKRLGLPTRILWGLDLVRVPWYPSLGAALRGLEKSLFVGVDYRVRNMAATTAVAGFGTLAPWLGAWRGRGWARRLCVAALALQALGYLAANRGARRRALATLPAIPVSYACLAWAGARAAWLAHAGGGVHWRGTAYPLAELRRHSGLEGLDGGQRPGVPLLHTELPDRCER